MSVVPAPGEAGRATAADLGRSPGRRHGLAGQLADGIVSLGAQVRDGRLYLGEVLLITNPQRREHLIQVLKLVLLTNDHRLKLCLILF